MELNGSNETVKRYTWGLDLAGQAGAGSVGVSPAIEGAGGIGGLLAVEDLDNGAEANDPEGSFLFCYDGNGNVGQLVRWSDFGPGEYGGSGQPATPAEWHSSRMVAKYEYDPYGNLIGPDGDEDGVFDPSADLTATARANPFRFSTKQWDDTTGLGYWGERYYSAKLGRWISRDPIGEEGSAQLVCYVANCPTIGIDALGLKQKECPKGKKPCSNGLAPTVNGCGAKWSQYVVPDHPPGGADFTAACNGHDRCYADCTKSKAYCDEEFRTDMQAACMLKYGWMAITPPPLDLVAKQIICLWEAEIYAKAVRDQGEKAHTETQDTYCTCCPDCTTTQPATGPATSPTPPPPPDDPKKRPPRPRRGRGPIVDWPWDPFNPGPRL